MTGIPTILKTAVHWMCLMLFSVVFVMLLAAVVHLGHEMELHNHIIEFIKEFWP